MSSIQFDPEAIRTLANILRDAGLTEIEIVEADRRIRVVRAATGVPLPVVVPAAAVPIAAAAASDDVAPAGAVTSPMVGVAFLSPEPGSAPFVALGSTVAVGQTVMLIEAMKTFNQIKATQAGSVTRILVSDGQPVEYGQPLLVIE